MIFISILTLIVAKALPLLNKQISSIHFTRITSIIFIYTGAITLNCLYIQSIGSGIGIYSGLFHITQISQLIEIFLFLIGGLILIGWPQILPSTGNIKKVNDIPLLNSKVENYSTDYSIIILFSILGSSLLISSFDLISLYLSIELQSFGLYILSTLYRDSESSTSAGLKYFLLGGLSSCLILLGIGLIYSYTGITNFESLYILNSISDIDQQYVLQGLSLGLIIIFIGFLFKIAAAPLHNWSPDVYDGTPTIVTTYLTIIPKISILILLLELQSQIGIIGGLKTKILSNSGYLINIDNLSSLISIEGLLILSNTVNSLSDVLNGLTVGLPVLKNLLLISSILSLIIGSLLGLAQIKIKRLLAYSTISHVGFLLLALAINTEQSIDSFLFYLIVYTITNLNIFLIILALSYINYTNTKSIDSMVNTFDFKESKLENIRDIRYISEFKGLFFSNPLLSLSFGICLFSMAGIPPLIGFFSKQFVLFSALQNGYYFISLIAIIVSVISASYYLKIIKVLITFEENIISNKTSILNSPLLNTNEFNINNNLNSFIFNNKYTLSNTHSFLISSLTLIILLFFIKPSIILNSTQLLSLSLFYI